MPADRGKYRKWTYNSRSIFAKNVPEYSHILRSASRYYGEVLDIRLRISIIFVFYVFALAKRR